MLVLGDYGDYIVDELDACPPLLLGFAHQLGVSPFVCLHWTRISNLLIAFVVESD